MEVKQPKGFGRVRMRHIPDASGYSLRPFVCDMVVPDSTILTDCWSGYNRLSQCGYTHKKTAMSSPDDLAHVAMPGVHRIASLLKRWTLGIHQGSVSDVHLQSYLEEFTFRFNRRTSRIAVALSSADFWNRWWRLVPLPTQKSHTVTISDDTRCWGRRG